MDRNPSMVEEKAKESILGYSLDGTSLSGYADAVSSWIQKGTSCRWLACLNPHSYAVSLKDTNFAKALREANWLIPDGIGIVVASQILGGHLRERVTGHDIFTGLHERLNRMPGARVFFLGSSEDTLAAICRKMNRDYPNIRVVGTHAPPFKASFEGEENEEILRRVNRAQPDVLWVGMTAPKQEKWIYQNRYRLNAKFAGAVGAVFDFYAGKVKRPNPFFQRLGLEWLPRLLREPRRLWKRMLVSAPVFLWHVLGACIQSHLHPPQYDEAKSANQDPSL